MPGSPLCCVPDAHMNTAVDHPVDTPAASRSIFIARSLASHATPLSAFFLAAPRVISVTFLPKLRVDRVSLTEVCCGQVKWEGRGDC